MNFVGVAEDCVHCCTHVSPSQRGSMVSFPNGVGRNGGTNFPRREHCSRGHPDINTIRTATCVKQQEKIFQTALRAFQTSFTCKTRQKKDCKTTTKKIGQSHRRLGLEVHIMLLPKLCSQKLFYSLFGK